MQSEFPAAPSPYVERFLGARNEEADICFVAGKRVAKFNGEYSRYHARRQ
jgi:hypothetical protein